MREIEQEEDYKDDARTVESVKIVASDVCRPVQQTPAAPENPAGEQAAAGHETLSPWKKTDWLPKYEVMEKVGEGSLTSVYKVRRPGIEQIFAAKVLRSEFAANPRTAKRFLQEAEKAASLNNPHLVSVYEVGKTASGEPFLICDCIDRGNLAQRLQNGRMAQVTVLEMFLHVAEGLAAAHKSGVLHRDIKPGNIVFQQGAAAELAKLADLGIAKVLPGAGRETKYFTPFGEAFGNPVYMSPEQLRGARLDERSDIYSLGCVMYECLCGEPPFSGKNPLQIAVLQMSEPAKPPSERFPSLQISSGMEQVVMHMLEKSVQNRYQSVSELLEDLRLIRKGGVPRALPPPVVENFDEGIIFDSAENVKKAEPQPIAIRFFPRKNAALIEVHPDETEGVGFSKPSAKTVRAVFKDLPFLLAALTASLICGVALLMVMHVDLGLVDPPTPYRVSHVPTEDENRFREENIQQRAKHYSLVSYEPPVNVDFGSPLIVPLKSVINRKNIIYYSDGLLRSAIYDAVADRLLLTGADLSGQKLDSLCLVGVHLSKADFRKANLGSTTFSGGDLSGAKFKGAQLDNTCFSGCDLTKADFSGADLSNTIFRNCILDGVSWGGQKPPQTPEKMKRKYGTGDDVIDQLRRDRRKFEG